MDLQAAVLEKLRSCHWIRQSLEIRLVPRQNRGP